METPHTIMLGAFVRENPLLAAIAGTVLLALVVLLAGALISRLLDRRRASARDEPAFDEGDSVDWGRAEPSGAGHAIGVPQATVSPHVRRHGFGFGVVAVAFLVGLVAGGAGIAVSSQSVATAVASLVELVEPGPPAVGVGVEAAGEVSAGDSPGAATGPQPGDPPSVGVATPPEVSAKLAIFADRLKASLPRAAGPELSLTRVDLDGMRLSLGYAVGRVMAEDETKAFDAYIMRTVKSLFCGRESREIRFLSENGVVFDMEYTGPGGETVTRLTVEPGFCA